MGRMTTKVVWILIGTLKDTIHHQTKYISHMPALICIVVIFVVNDMESTHASSVQEQYPDFLPFFTPDLPLEDLEDWLSVNQGSIAIRGGQNRIPILAPSGFIRSPSLHFTPQVFVRWIRGPDPKGLLIECRRFGKRKNLLERASYFTELHAIQSRPNTIRVAATECTLDFLPWG